MSHFYYPEDRIAVVAMGGLFPDADNLDVFWQNILNKKVSIQDLPSDILDPDIYYRPELIGKASKQDKTYTKIGTIVNVKDFLPLCGKYKIPPTVADHMDPNQKASVYCVDQALSALRSTLPKERTAVIMGTGAQGIAYQNVLKRLHFQRTEYFLKNRARLEKKFSPEELDELINELSYDALKDTIPITEDTAPGTLQSITAARISNILDLHGPAYTIDAACASTLAAAERGIEGLLKNDFDAVITGGIEITLAEYGHIIFSGINALSPDGSYPFDSRANGFAVGLGGGVLILKRLRDAVRDNDQIVSILSGFGQGSDGKGKSIAAPSEEGQVRVIEEAYKKAGIQVDTVELIEAHGTGTIVGDVVELNALKKAFANLGATRRNYCGISAVKSNIGHLRYASGSPSLIKTSIALHNKVLPPTANIIQVNPKLELENSPFYILTEAASWQESKEHPRRAGVSAYGFGGANFHIVMEEYRDEFFQKTITAVSYKQETPEIKEVEVPSLKDAPSLKESIVYSGVSMGLPGSFKKAFADDNFDLLLEGRNFIEMLTGDEAESILDLHITRLMKTEEGSVFKTLTSVNEVIQLAGKLGKLDMPEDYLVDEKTLKQMTRTVCAGIAAGYEALKDAGIPLVREMVKTTGGTELPGGWLLPEEMRESTGIIYGNGILPIEPVISEVSRYVAQRFGSSMRSSIISFYESVIAKVSDQESKKVLSDWFTLHYSRLNYAAGEGDIYEFNHNFLSLLHAQANNRLAQFINAFGPNFMVSSACSSTASAVTLAEDLIRAGHAQRMIVVAADNTSSKEALPWLGAGFLSNGSATNSASVYDAAVPFDKRRNGLILSAGAVGLVVEKEADVAKRGMNGICRILGTHMFNTGGSQSKIVTSRYCIEMDKFIGLMEKQYHLQRSEIASRTVYYSHETCTPRNGGCSETEKKALESTFGSHFRKIKVINTKGMLGHTIGASIEEAAAARALQYQKLPPIVNYKEPDPELEGLNLSKGGAYPFEFVLRMVIGFGGQGNFHLLQKIARGNVRITDNAVYQDWLKKITSSDKAEIKTFGRLMVVEGVGASVSVPARQEEQPVKPATESKTDVSGQVLAVYSEVTRYPVEMLDKEMEMEADLGIDTVKQATIFALLGEKFGVPESEGANLSKYKTIGSIIDYIEGLQNVPISTSVPVMPVTKNIESLEKQPVVNLVVSAPAVGSVEQTVLEVVSDITRYPVEMLDKEMEMEADLGIDTVKQATIISLLGEKFALDQAQAMGISRVKTIGDIIDSVSKIHQQKPEEVPVTPVPVKDVSEALPETMVNQSQEQQVERFLSFQIPVFQEAGLGTPDYDIKNKHIWVLGDEAELVRSAVDFYQQYSINTSGFIFHKTDTVAELENRAADFTRKPVDVIIDCTHLSTNVDFEAINRDEERELLFNSGPARFIFYKKLSENQERPALRIVCALSMDGCHGFRDTGNAVHEPFYGAICGFYKGLRKEWPESKIRVIDLGPRKAPLLSQDELLRLTDELQSSSIDYETGYFNENRMTLKIDNLELSELEGLELPEDAHFVFTGGGNGITSEIIRELSTRFKGRYTVLGRTEVPVNVLELASLSSQELESKKSEIHQKMKDSGQKASPFQVQSEFDKIIKSVSIFRLSESIRQAGGSILYIPCDVRDDKNLAEALRKAVDKFGPVRVLVHAAGIEKSRLISQKGLEEFNEVFSVKAAGLCSLYRLIDKKELKAFVGFGSVSGRFGNEAQLDYCAANSFISSFMAMVKAKYPHIHALNMAWSGWQDVGMAWRNEFIKNHAEDIGIHLIEPRRGSESFIQLLTRGLTSHEVIISKGLRHFVSNSMLADPKSDMPFLDWIKYRDGKPEKAYKVFSVRRDQIIDHHRLGDTPLVPAVGFMEMCAELFTVYKGRKEQYCFKNIELFNPLKLHYEKPREVQLTVKNGPEPDCLEFTASTYLDSKMGLSKLTELNRMQISGTAGDYEDLLSIRAIEHEVMVKGYTREELIEKRAQFENVIQLGPLFIDVEKDANVHYLNQNGALYSARMPREEFNNPLYPIDQYLLNPAFLDTMYQICGMHTMMDGGRVYLPWKVGEFGVVHAPVTPGNYQLYARIIEQSEELKTYHVIMLSDKGVLCCYARNVAMRRISL